MRVRCSDGLRVAEHYGNFHQRNSTDLALAAVDANSSITAAFTHDSKLDERLEVGFQVALLYTTASGQRRIRVHNISLPAVADMHRVFKHADHDAVISFFVKAGISFLS